MITAKGYSKDPTIQPTGIVITWPDKMLNYQEAGKSGLLRLFEKSLKQGEFNYWCHKLNKAPKKEIIHVYIIVGGFVKYRCYYIDHLPNAEPWPYIRFTGPIEQPQQPIPLKGFQGFRYCTDLF